MEQIYYLNLYYDENIQQLLFQNDVATLNYSYLPLHSRHD